jgi:dTDP-4-dehydrorhamnose 3,5-epimerase
MDRTNHTSTGSLQGVTLALRKKIRDDRGAVFHMLRRDDPEFQAFGEVYFSLTHPGVVKAWKLHKRMGLNLFLVSGKARLVLVDGRNDSPTKGQVQQIELDETNGPLVVIPPGIWSGFQATGKTDAILANCATEPHDPTEVERRDVNDPEFPKVWD